MAKSSTDAFLQTRNARGMLPVTAVRTVSEGAACEPLEMDAFRFEPVPPVQASSMNALSAHDAMVKNTKGSKKAKPSPVPAAPCNATLLSSKHSTKDMPLLQLAACIKRVTQTLPDGTQATVNGVAISDVAAMAEKLGPLLAREPFAYNAADDKAPLAADEALEESRDLWASAVIAANLAVTIQEFVSEHIPFVALENKLPSLVKRTVTNPETGNTFSLFFVTLGLNWEYAQWLGTPAFIRREAIDGLYNYSFLLQEDYDGAPVELMCASFAHEITASDYALLSAACELPEAIDRDVHQRLDFDADAHKEKTALELDADNLLGQNAAIDKEDLPVLRSMVRALVAAHMGDARVDLFSANEETGYLAFDSVLSWLWYDFSRGLEVARIRYCAYCGKAFALVGHRGPDKLFCSIACKNDARNDRTGQRRNKVRALFREEGATVADLAERYFADEGKQEGQRRVRVYLSSWPTLKHDLDDDIATNGWSCPLLKRCRAEGLDMDKLLSAKRKTELKKLMQKK